MLSEVLQLGKAPIFIVCMIRETISVCYITITRSLLAIAVVWIGGLKDNHTSFRMMLQIARKGVLTSTVCAGQKRLRCTMKDH